MHILIDSDQFEKLIAKVDALHSKLAVLETPHQNDWLTPDEVMELLKISSRCLQNYRDEGKIGYTQIGRRKIYYSRKSVTELLEKNYSKPSQK